ncbi:hypothetical protein V6N13_020024 [Hibiscus sabdariffa]
MAPVRRGRGRKDPSSSGTKRRFVVPNVENETRVSGANVEQEVIAGLAKKGVPNKSEWIPNFSNDIDLLSKHLATGAKHVVSGGEESNAKVKIEERVGVVVHDGGGGVSLQ